MSGVVGGGVSVGDCVVSGVVRDGVSVGDCVVDDFHKVVQG